MLAGGWLPGLAGLPADRPSPPPHCAVNTCRRRNHPRLPPLRRPRLPCSCFSMSWEEIVAIGPTRVIVRRGAETRAIKENEGIVDEGISLLVQLVVGPDGDKEAAGGPDKKAAAGDDSYR